MKETESTEGEAREEEQLTVLDGVIQKAGLDSKYWTKLFKAELDVEHAEQLQFLNVKEYEILKKHVRHEWEKRALRKILGIQEEALKDKKDKLAEHKKVQQSKLESEKVRIAKVKKDVEELKKLYEEGKDHRDAKVKQMQDDVRSTLEVPEKSWLPSDKSLKDIIEPLFQRLCSVQDCLGLPAETISDEEVLRLASCGLALEGMYKTGDLEDLLEKRQQLIEVPESFRLRGPEHNSFYEKKDFFSHNSQTKFQRVMEKLGISFCVSLQYGAFGFASESKREQEQSTNESKKSESTYILNTQYNYIPLASCLIEKDKLRLTHSALNELKKIEMVSLNVNETEWPEVLREVEHFFHTFGSHINQGPLHFGGVFWWKASAEGFSSSELTEMKSLTSDSLNVYVGVGSSLGLSAGVNSSLSKCKGSFQKEYSDSLLRKVQLSVSKSGGPAETDDHLKWKSGLVTSNSRWCVIDRGATLVPIWDIILSAHGQDFQNASKLSNVIMEAYKEVTKQDCKSLWGQDVLSTIAEAQKMIQSVKIWSVSKSQKHLRELLEIKAKLKNKTGLHKAWVRECLSNQGLQDFLTQVSIECADISLKVMVQSVMDQAHNVEDFPNKAKIQNWAKLTKEEPPKVCSVTQFSELERILNEVKDGFNSPAREPGMSPEERATCTVTNAFNSLCQTLRENREADVELLMRSIVNIVGYKEDTFCPPLGVEEVVFLQQTLFPTITEYSSLKERNESKAQAYSLLTALTVSQNKKKRISPEDKDRRLKNFTSKAENFSHVSMLIRDARKHNDWKKLERDLNFIINETSQSDERKGLQRKIHILDNFMKPMPRNAHPALQVDPGDTGTQQGTQQETPPRINDQKAEQFKNLLQRLGIWESYPRKIQMKDVLLVKDLSSKNQRTEKDLHHQYLYKMMMLDCSARNLCLKVTESPEVQTSFPEAGDSSDDEDYTADAEKVEDFSDKNMSIHPMDIHLAVLHCSDDFVRQYIFSKLSTCQFALPLLVPNPTTGEIEFPLWALRQIKKTLQKKQQYIFNAPVPIVSFVRLGKSSNSKSQILSNIISKRKHPVFFNRHCNGSMRQCLLMDGVVEIVWYCGGSNDGDVFDDSVAFVNLHGDASKHPAQLQFLQEVSSATVLLLSENALEEEAKETFTELRKSPAPLITLISHSENVKGKKSHTNIKIAAKNRNEAELTEEIISSIKQCLSTKMETASLATCLEVARQNKFRIDEDIETCREGKEQAQTLMSLLIGGNRKEEKEEEFNLKRKHLPLQGKLWEDWCVKNKQQYRLPSTGERSIEMELSDIKAKKQSIRIDQLNTALQHSDFMMSFLQCLHQSEENQNLYMLQWLQIFLEEYTTGTHANLQEKYHSIWTEMRLKPQGEDKELERKLEGVSEEIRAISVGLQHLMREMSQLYEAVKSIATNEDFTDVRCVDTLPRIGAEMLIAGYPLELMDGDVAHVPLEWIEAVFEKLIQKLGDKKVFVLSVLGLQSSGKSTLLNTMFGLQFAVSAGRCTRGAFMQLLEVDEKMRGNLQFDFVLVVDTEGLRSPELSSEATLSHDNELATFIIGVGNMTLINIMGENPCEMQDILQICVQAFMRMTSVRIKTSCIFVHQNVAETTASDKNQEGRRRLQKRLDQITATAAKEENLDIRSFSNIIQFDVDSQVFYFKNLLEGDPPMAPPNPSYSQNVQELKNKLLTISQWQPACNLPTLSEVKKRIKDLWEALLGENFVFSFRNTLEIAVYSKLEKFYSQWSWSIRKHALEIQQIWRNKISSNLKDAVYVSDLMKEFGETYKTLTDEIDAYFRSEEHPEILVSWRASINKRFEGLRDQLIEDTHRKCTDLLNIKKCRSELDSKRIGYEAELLNMSRSLASKLQDQQLTSKEMRPHFDELWTKWATKITSEKLPEKHVDIQAVVEGILHKQFTMEKEILKEIQQPQKKFQFQLDKHVPLTWKLWLKEKVPGFNNVAIQKEGEQLSEQIIADVKKYIKNKSMENLDFNEIFVHEILESISQAINAYQKESKQKKITTKYKVDISVYTCTNAVKEFKKMHTDFRKKNDLLTCLNEKKEEYFQYFKDSCDGATSVTIFVNFLCNYLRSAIQQEVYNKVSLQIVIKMKSSYPAFSGNRCNLEDHILKELAHKQDFGLYVEYLERPKQHFEQFIKGRVEEYCKDHKKTSELLITNLSMLVEKTLNTSFSVTSAVAEKEGNISMWLDEFCSELGSDISIARDDFKNMESEDTGNLKFLQDMMATSLSAMQENVKKELRKTALDLNIFRNRPDDILIEEHSACWEQCPFCKAICTNSKHGNERDHSVNYHRPETLGGWRYSFSNEFSVDFCTTSVSSDGNFFNSEGKSIPFKEYWKAGPPFSKWKISPDNSEKLYWKWFVHFFRKDLQEKFGCKFEGKGKIPSDWEKISKDSVLKELK